MQQADQGPLSLDIEVASFKLVLAHAFGMLVASRRCLLTAARLLEECGACTYHVTLTVVQGNQHIVDHQMWPCDAEPPRMKRRMW